MNITITNKTAAPLPAVSGDAGGWSASLPPNESYSLNDNDIAVVVIGDKASFVDDFTGALKVFMESVAQVLLAWRKHPQVQAQTPPVVTVQLANHGERAIRVLLGVNTNEYQMAPGEIYDASAAEYIELRELSGYNPVEKTT